MCEISEDLTGEEKLNNQRGKVQNNSFLPLFPFPSPQPHCARQGTPRALASSPPQAHIHRDFLKHRFSKRRY